MMYDENELGLPKVYEDDMVMIFLVKEEKEPKEEDSEDTESMEDDIPCPHKKTQQGISQFSMPIMSDKIERLLLSIIGE